MDYIFHFYNGIRDIRTSEPYCSMTDTQIIETINMLFQLHYDCMQKNGPWFVNSSESPYNGCFILYGEWLIQALQNTRENQQENIVVFPKDRFEVVMEKFSMAKEYRDFCQTILN